MKKKTSTIVKMNIKFVAQILKMKGSAIGNYARTIGVSLTSPGQTVLFGNPKYIIGFIVTFCCIIKIMVGKNTDLTSSVVVWHQTWA